MTTGRGLRAAVGRALAIDPAGFQPYVALRGTAGVVIPVAIGTATGHPAEGTIVAAGALPAGVAGIGGGFRSRAAVILATTVGMTISTFVGGLVAGHVGVTIAVLAVWGFAAGIAVVLGRDATIVGTQAVIGLIVFGRFPGTVAASAVHAMWVLAGGGFQGMLTATLRSPQRFAAERRALAIAYSELAALAHNPDRSSLPAADAAAAVATMISRRSPDDDLDVLRGLVDEADRIRLEILALATVRERVSAVGSLLAATTESLDRLAVAIRNSERLPDDDPVLTERADALQAYRDDAPVGQAGTSTRYAAARASALLGQLRAAGRLTNALAGVRRLALPRQFGAPVIVTLPKRAADSLRQVQMAARDPTTSAFRHGVRLAVVLPLCEALSHVVPWQRGYWITLTAVVVLKPDYAATAQRGLARVGGTTLGVVLAGLVAVGIDPTGGALVPLIALSTWAGYACFAASYALYSFAVTTTVVFLLAPIVSSELSTVADRGLDTLIGGAIAMLAYAVWPTWERDTLTAAITRLLDALASYVDVLLSAYVDPDSIDREQVRDVAAAARRARMAAQASYDRAAAEPKRGRAGIDAAAGVLSATRRIVVELHALRATLDDTSEHIAVPAAADITRAIVAALHDLAAGRPPAVDDLRGLQQALAGDHEDDLASLRSRRRALIAAHLDPLVDSVDTLAHVARAATEVAT